MIVESLLSAFAASMAVDLAFGDPPNRYHPVAWVGGIVSLFVPKLKTDSEKNEKLYGIVFALGIVFGMGILVHVMSYFIFQIFGLISIIVFSLIFLKSTIAIKGMEDHARAVMAAVQHDDLARARHELSMIVRRETKNLDKEHILSGTIECIAESTVDGIVSPMFYYSVFGPAGSFAYRIINTLDSMLGYKDAYYINIGYMSARLDSAANFIPARITAALIVISSVIVHADWHCSIKILKRDRANTSSLNAGYPMASIAGALGVRLEKIGHYTLGDNYDNISIRKCELALSIMKLTSILFCFMFTLPVMLILNILGWWTLIFGH